MTKSKLLLRISFILLFILSAFRSELVGTDTKGYFMLFERMQRGIEIRQEVLWRYLNQLVVYVGGDFNLLLIISSLLVLVPVYLVIKSHSPYKFFSLFLYYSLYFYLFSLNITRQSIAVGFTLLALVYLIDDKKKKFVLFVLLATGFHTTAILSLFLLFIDRIPNKDRFLLLISGITIFIGIFLSGPLFTLAGSLFGYLQYVEAYELGTIPGNFAYLLILSLFLYFLMKTSDYRGRLFKLFYVFIIVSNLVIRIPFGDRIVLYFAIIQIIYLPYYLYVTKLEPRQLAVFIVVLYAFVMFFRKLGAGEIFPYYNTLF
ncbi:EpsG family protein [Myroides sp. ZB35]|uniref:EpsG family protein n=1 Tax=Myroides sp. ZB35 TaxID=1458492 RepID=UPI0008F49011|nr:EpsG family protein [Myroides sp. ZB35]APA93621.1 hypothetical protein BK054_15585 [Myroides sp. ZB35]